MGRTLALAAALAGLASGFPSGALAGEQTLTSTSAPIAVDGYGVATGALLVPSPSVDGFVVGMDAEVVDEQGNVQGRDRVMLHHLVFGKVGSPDYTCGGGVERFYAEGEERTRFRLPAGYGYVTGEPLTPVKPVWLDVRNCTGARPDLRRARRRQALLHLHAHH